MSAIGVDVSVLAARRIVLLLVLSCGGAMGIVPPARASASLPTALASTEVPRHLLARQDAQPGQKKKKSSSFLQKMLEEKLREQLDEDDQAIVDALRQRERNERSRAREAAAVQQQAPAVAPSSVQYAQPITRAASGANGHTVTQVTFGQQGQPLGQFRQIAPGQWQEAGASGSGFSFQETNRDDWSVYLSDPSRGVRVQLDLHRKLVLYQDETAPGMRPLYEIMESAATAPSHAVVPVSQPAPTPLAAPASRPATTMGADGRTVTQATFGQQGQPMGQFRQTGQRTWQESSGSGGGFTFEESDRDDWSVYLLDASRGVRIQLDLHRKLVLYADGSSAEMSPLYEILSASSPALAHAPANSPSPSSLASRPAPPVTQQPTVAPSQINANGRTVTQASFGQQGRVIGQFLQTGPGRWRESGAPGSGFEFDEINRDDWSVYLHDRSRNVRVQLDLYRRQVLYAGSGAGEMTPLYEIFSADSPRVTPFPSGVSPTDAQTYGRAPTDPQPTPGGSDSASRKDFCWKDSQGRGVGEIPGACGAGRERLGLLCYTKCPINSQRFGLDCHTVCPSGMKDDGLFCRAAEYGRGGGFPVHFGEFNGDGMKRRCEAEHGRGGCEMNGLIYYPKCKAGYSAFGCCMCRPNPPNCAALGMNPGIDLSCAKQVVIGDPQTGTCAAGMEKDGGLCYPQCKAGYTGVGPVCWAAPPSSWVECGMGAARSSQVCGEIVFGQVASVGQVAFNLATLGSGTAASGAVSTASKAGRLADLKRRYEQLRSLYKANEHSIRAALAAKQAHGATVHAVELLDTEVVTEEDIARIAAEIAAIADPTGVSDTVAAYTYPVCSKYGF